MFYLEPVGGGYCHYKFQNKSGEAVFLGMSGLSIDGTDLEYSLNHLEDIDVQVHLVGMTAFKTDKRSVLNVKASSNPTLNLVPDPMLIIDEQGGTTPAINYNYEDPDGNYNAVKLNFTAQYQPLCVSTTTSNVPLPLIDYRSRWTVKAFTSNGANVAIGSENGLPNQYENFFVDDSDWTVLDFETTTFANNYRFGIRNVAGGTAEEVYAYCPQVYDEYSGKISSTEEERIAYEQLHAKPITSFAGAVSVSNTGMLSTPLIIPYERELTEFTIGGVVDVTSAPTNAFGTIMSIAKSSTTSYLDGMIGVATTGKLYAQPNLNIVTSTAQTNLINQGLTTVFLTRSPTEMNLYINGVLATPAMTKTLAPMIVDRFAIGGYSITPVRYQSGYPLTGEFDHMIVEPRAMSWEEIIDLDQKLVKIVQKEGKTMGDRSVLVLSGFDSLMYNDHNPNWMLANQNLTGWHFVMDAVGGSHWYDTPSSSSHYNNSERNEFRFRVMTAALEVGFENVVGLFGPSTNDLASSTRKLGNYSTWETEAEDMFSFWDAEKASIDDSTGRLKYVVPTIGPRAGAPTDYDPVRSAYHTWLYNDSGPFDAIAPVHLHVPVDFTDLDAASADAYTNGENSVYQYDGIHYSTTSSTNETTRIATMVYKPVIESVLN